MDDTELNLYFEGRVEPAVFFHGIEESKRSGDWDCEMRLILEREED